MKGIDLEWALTSLFLLGWQMVVGKESTTTMFRVTLEHPRQGGGFEVVVGAAFSLENAIHEAVVGVLFDGLMKQRDALMHVPHAPAEEPDDLALDEEG